MRRTVTAARNWTDARFNRNKRSLASTTAIADRPALVYALRRSRTSMPVTLTEKNDGRILEVQVTGKLSHEDGHLVPAFERLVREHGKLGVLFEMVDFHGWEAGALWDD